DALRQGRAMGEKGISIDVGPIHYPLGGDVLVEKLTLPPDVRKGQPVDLRVVLNNTNDHDVTGALRIERQTDNAPIVLNPDPASQRVSLRPGKNVFSYRLNLDEPQFYKYQATFVPDKRADDMVNENNRAGVFTNVRGKGRVLLIEDRNHRGEFEHLAVHLRQ